MDDWWETIERFAREKAEGQKQSATAKAIASAVVGRKLTIPQGLAAGAAGGQVSVPSLYTLSNYLGLSIAANRLILTPGAPLAGAPARLVGVTRFLFGPVAVGATVVGVSLRRTVLPPTEGESPLISIPFGLVTGGLESGPRGFDPLGGELQRFSGELSGRDAGERSPLNRALDAIADEVDGTVLDFFDRRHQQTVGGFGTVLNLIPVWEADP